jgi:hypothetical protein
MTSLVSAALVAALAGTPDVAYLELSDNAACARLKAELPGDPQEVAVVAQERGCALRMPGVSAWAARPPEMSELLGVAGLDRVSQAELDGMMKRLARQKPVEAHLLALDSRALIRAEDAVDEFNRGRTSPSTCTCAWASIEQSPGWVAWTVKATGHCGNGLFAGDAPAWCPESDRFLTMLNGIAALLVVTAGLIVRRWTTRRRQRSASAGPGGTANPSAPS